MVVAGCFGAGAGGPWLSAEPVDGGTGAPRWGDSASCPSSSGRHLGDRGGLEREHVEVWVQANVGAELLEPWSGWQSGFAYPPGARPPRREPRRVDVPHRVTTDEGGPVREVRGRTGHRRGVELQARGEQLGAQRRYRGRRKIGRRRLVAPDVLFGRRKVEQHTRRTEENDEEGQQSPHARKAQPACLLGHKEAAGITKPPRPARSVYVFPASLFGDAL